MLVLTRKRDESVVIGSADGLNRLLKVTVLEIRNGVVKLGFEADDSIPVHRAEVWETIASQKWDQVNDRKDNVAPAEQSRALPRRQMNDSLATVKQLIARQTLSGNRSK